jgi:hypothetical protein
MVSLRRHLRAWAVAWIVFQGTSLSALVPIDACAARLSAAAAEQTSATTTPHKNCHANAAPAPCPMRANSGLPCPMHRGTSHDMDQSSRETCSMRGTCDPPVAALLALLSNHGVLTPSSATSPDLSRSWIAPSAAEDPASRLAPPASPPPRA